MGFESQSDGACDDFPVAHHMEVSGGILGRSQCR